MTPAVDTRVDIADVRARHRIEDVIAASGVELRRTGSNLMGCCPFHDDHTASLSVGGVPGRFHCFGCGASGDVIEYVTRLTGLPFRDAVAHLDHPPTTRTTPTAATARASRPRPDPAFDMTPDRAFEINDLAWRRFTRPVYHEHALAYLRTRRGIDLTGVEHATGAPQVGYAAADWATLTRHLLATGVTEDELTALDLAQRTRRGTLIDTLRGRLVVPVRDHHDRITGFIGRDTSADNANRDPRTPKYRNPTRTPVFDRAQMLYAVRLGPRDAARAVVVEGPLDVLAVGVAAATTGVPMLACSTAGVSVSRAQARAVSALTRRPVVLALDGDAAGRDGTTRWVELLHRRLHHPITVADLPDGRDLADVLAQNGPTALLDLLARARPPAYELARITRHATGPVRAADHVPSRDL